MIRLLALRIVLKLIHPTGPMIEYFPNTTRDFAAKFPDDFQGNEVAANGFLCGYMAGVRDAVKLRKVWQHDPQRHRVIRDCRYRYCVGHWVCAMELRSSVRCAHCLLQRAAS